MSLMLCCLDTLVTCFRRIVVNAVYTSMKHCLCDCFQGNMHVAELVGSVAVLSLGQLAFLPQIYTHLLVGFTCPQGA